MKFRKKPVVIEAIQFLDENKREIKERFIPNYRTPLILISNEAGTLLYGEITTLEGTHKVTYGDWIIEGVQGELYPCKPDIFEQTYEAVEK